MAIAPAFLMGVLLVFVRPNAEPFPSGPYAKVSFSFDDLIADGEAVATYIENRWQVRGLDQRFSSVEFHSRVDVHFERNDGERSKAFGPSTAFRLLDGVAYASDRVFAFFDKERQDWYSLALGSHWSKMTFVDALGEPQN